MQATKNKWGFLRETEESAKKAGIDKDTGLHRTCLKEYLKIIFPNVDDWINDKMIESEIQIKRGADITRKIRPDFRSEKLSLIIEFDGLQHYQKPDIIEKDFLNMKYYENLGYKVVRIPYFIQLTNQVVEELFDVKVKEELFDENISSMGVEGKNTPAYLCPLGIKRMATEFKKFPKQYKVNIEFLRQQNDSFKTGVEFLEKEYSKLQ